MEEFEEGMYCSKAYENVYYANQRLCERLGKEEDENIECIISNLLKEEKTKFVKFLYLFDKVMSDEG